MPGFALALPIALTALGLAIATMFRTIEFERVGTFLGAVAGLTIAGWAISSLLSFVLLPDNPGSRIDSDWSRYAVIGHRGFHVGAHRWSFRTVGNLDQSAYSGASHPAIPIESIH